MIRKATPDDIPAIRKMAEVAFPDTYKDILTKEQQEYMMDMMYSEQSLRRQMNEEKNTFFICEGRGYVSYRPDGLTEDGLPLYHLEKLYVLPQFQGTGLGRELFNTVVDAVRASVAGGSSDSFASGASSGSAVQRSVGAPAGSAVQRSVGAPANCKPFADVSSTDSADTAGSSAAGARIELNVNRYNKALSFYEHIGMRRVRQGDFPIGGGFFMNDYIMSIDC